MGMALEKQKAMEHPYPATMDKIEAFGYDPKQLHHALRLREFMTRYEAGEPYADCLISNQCSYLKEVKRGCYSLEEARALMSTAIQSMTEDKKRYMDTVPVSINQHANEVLQKTTIVGRGHAVKELAKYLDFNNATVTVAHSKTKSLLQATQNRDVVIYATPIITQDISYNTRDLVIDLGNSVPHPDRLNCPYVNRIGQLTVSILLNRFAKKESVWI